MTTHENGRLHPEWKPEPARCVRCQGEWHIEPHTDCIGFAVSHHDVDRLTLAQIDQALADARGRTAGQTGARLAHYTAHIAALMALRDDALSR